MRGNRNLVLTAFALVVAACLLMPVAAFARGGGEGPVSLTLTTWRVADVGDAFDVLLKMYKEKHPNVTINVKNVPTDQYYATLNTMLLSGDPPDIITSHPTLDHYFDLAKNGYFVDLTGDPMLKTVISTAVDSMKLDGKVWGIPYDYATLGVIYNKKIFADNNLKIPTDYQQMLQLCDTLKSKGITPVAFGLKDSYLSCFLPWQIAPTVIYAKNPHWDADLMAGKVKFNGPEWKQILAVTFDFQKRGYFTPDALGIGDQQTVELFAKGQAAMVFTGNWSIGVARAANPNLDPGFFCFPANAPGEELWITNTIGEAMSVAKGSKNVAAAKTALAMFTDKAYAQPWTDRARNISTIIGVNNNFDPALKDFGAYLAAHKSWQFTNYGWPAGVSDVFFKRMQEIYAGKGTVEDMLNEMDKTAHP